MALGVEHPNRLTLDVDEWSDWLAFWRVNPWGETRQDEREEVSVLWHLLPHMGKQADIPYFRYPYQGEREESTIDLEQGFQMLKEAKRRGSNSG